jgi:hypothetical protein
MTDKTDETGKGAPGPGGGPRRPYATLDLQATEVGGKGRVGAAGASERTDNRAASLPPPTAKGQGSGRAFLSDRLSTARAWARRAAESNTFLSHVAAGAAGAVLTLAAAGLLGLFAGGDRGRLSGEVSKRLAAVEQALEKRDAALGNDLRAKLAAAETRVAGLEQRTRTVAGLADAQARLAADTKALEARLAAPELAERVAKVEAALTALAGDDKSGRIGLGEDLATRLAGVEKLAGKAAETAKAGASRIEHELAALKSQTGGFGQRFDALKAEVEERFKSVAKAGELAPVLAKLAAFEQDLRAFLKSEDSRAASAQRVLLTLEIANLKRAMDRGTGFAKELDAVKKVAGGTIDLTPLERYSHDGFPALTAIVKDFRRVANAAIDAESESADASMLDRLMASARSIVRIRKVGHSPDDTSVEAVVGRMEGALKDGSIGEVLAQGKKLPPKAALAAEDWLKKLEARHAADRAVADLETALKSSFAAQRLPAPEPQR